MQDQTHCPSTSYCFCQATGQHCFAEWGMMSCSAGRVIELRCNNALEGCGSLLAVKVKQDRCCEGGFQLQAV